METLREGKATVSGSFQFPGYGTEIPFSVTVGDNCCARHASSAAREMVSLYARQLQKEEREHVIVSYLAGKEQ